MLRDFVERTCIKRASHLSRSFFLDDRIIRNYIMKSYEKHQSKIDQNALSIKIKQWEKSQTNDIFYFRPFNEESGSIKQLLFRQQTEWQRIKLQNMHCELLCSCIIFYSE